MLDLSLAVDLNSLSPIFAPGTPAPNPADVYSSSLWTGLGIAQPIINGIDLAGKGGMVWSKNRDSTEVHKLFDTVRGPNTYWNSATTGSVASLADSLTGFTGTGFNLGAATGINTLALKYVGWVFRKSPRFFDAIGYTGDGSALRAIPHALGVVPGLVIIKRRDSAGSAAVSHIQNNPGHQYNLLNDTALPTVNDVTFGGVPPDASNVYLGTNAIVNAVGGTYIMYVFAHDPAPDGIIQCGKYTGNGSLAGPTIALGWQPQYLLFRRVTGGVGNWTVFDAARGMPSGPGDLAINPNTPNAEVTSDTLNVSSTGFQLVTTSTTFNVAGSDYVYMAVKAA